MISVQRSFGRLVIVTATAGVDTMAVLTFQQSLSAVVRRLGDPALVVVDLRELGGLEPDVARMFRAMLQGGAGLARLQVVLPGPEGSFGADLAAWLEAEENPRRVVARDVDALRAVLRPLATPPEVHAVGALFAARKAA